MATVEYKYKAFISYNHNDRDSRVAQALHSRIEIYTVPRKLRKNGAKKLGKVFRDQEELSVSSDLNQHIRDALDESEFLIVICSPGAVVSCWVSKEIAYFLEHHAPEKVLTVLTGGNGGEIYEALLPGLPEPLSLDLTGIADEEINRKLKERFLKLCAPLLDCKYDNLVLRDQKRQRRIFRGWLAGITAVAAVIIGILLWSNWQIEGKNQELDQKNQELDQKNEALEQQNQELLLRESELLTKDAQIELEEKNNSSAVMLALSALPDADTPRPYYAPAEEILFSAMEVFQDNAEVVLPKNTVLNQETPVEDYSVSKDGSLLFTVNPYSVVACFDTVTGEQIWVKQIEQQDSYMNVQIQQCERWDSILIWCDSDLTALSRKTGEILWVRSNAYADGPFLLSDDEQLLIRVVDKGYSGHVYAEMIDAETGEVWNWFDIVKTDQADFVIDQENSYAISPDGSLFAGMYTEKVGQEEYRNVYFVTNLVTGETTSLYGWEQGAYANTNMVYDMFFSDQDETLTILRTPDDAYDGAVAEKLRVADGRLLWQCPIPEGNPLDFGMDDYLILPMEEYLLIGYQADLFALDPETGELLYSLSYHSNLVCLEHVQDIYFTYLLEDGTAQIGSVNSYGLHDLGDWMSHTTMMLEPIQDGSFFNRGFLRYYSMDGESGFEFMDPEQAGYIIMIPADNNHSVIIRRAKPFHPDLGEQVVFTTELSERIDTGTMAVCGENTICVEYTHTDSNETQISFCLIDRANLETSGSFRLDHEQHYYEFSVLRDGVGVFFEENWKQYAWYDVRTGSTERNDYSGKLVFGEASADTDIKTTGRARLSGDHSLLIVMALGHGLRLHYDNDRFMDIPYPDQMILPENMYLGSDDLIVGSNGCILLDLLREGAEPFLRDYLIYDSGAERWSKFPYGSNDAAHHLVCLGNADPVIAVMDSEGLLRIGNTATGEVTLEVTTGLTPNSVEQIQWIMDDRYLAIYTFDGTLMIVDALNGEIPLLEETGYYFWNPPSFCADSQGKWLFFWDTDGVCVDLESWTVLAMIPDMIFYDRGSDRIFRSKMILEGEEFREQITAVQFPTTEKMLELAHQYLS